MDEDVSQIKEFLRTYHTPDELVLLLEITTEDLLREFEYKVHEHKHKFTEITDE